VLQVGVLHRVGCLLNVVWHEQGGSATPLVPPVRLSHPPPVPE
jgi:hypothetical protein